MADIRRDSGRSRVTSRHVASCRGARDCAAPPHRCIAHARTTVRAGGRSNGILARRPVRLLRIVVMVARRRRRQRIVFRIPVRIRRRLGHRSRVIGHGALVRFVTAAARRPRLVFVLRYRQSRARLQRDSSNGRREPRAASCLRAFVSSCGRAAGVWCRPACAPCGTAWRAAVRAQRRSAGVSTSRRTPGSSTSSSLTGAVLNSARAPVSPSSAASAS